MRSLTVLHTEWSDGWGGQEIRVVEEARGVAECGHRVLIVARPQCRILAKAREAGLETRELEMRRAFDFAAVKKLRDIIRAERADIVVTHSSVDSWIGTFAAKHAGAKLIRTRHLSSEVPSHPFNIIYRLPDAVVTTGESVRRQLIKHSRLREEKVVSIPTGVDVEKFAPRPADLAAKRALGLPDDCKVVTMVAVLRKFKRHELFLEAARLLKGEGEGLRFLVVGEGPRRAHIERMIREKNLGECVIMTGHLDDVRPVLSFTDVAVLSSGWGEGVPQAVAQALAMARPVVATDVGSVSELVRNEETGLLVPKEHAEKLAAGISRMLKEAEFAKECGERGNNHVVANFSRQKMIEDTLRLYERLVQSDSQTVS
jgi:glycosyltransferase involved in cell wall biosynthesis